MGSNRFGSLFSITTWGESHGKAIGVVIDGCPAGLTLTEEDINQELSKRRPGQITATSSRKETDECQILSGLFENTTTGAPISIIIPNRDVRSKDYEQVKKVLRPGHANFTYLEKYGIYDYRGGGRASARETACRVAAGAVAKKLLKLYNIEITTYLHSIDQIELPSISLSSAKEQLHHSSIFCPCKETELKMVTKIKSLQEEGDSTGGIISCIIENLPPGLGDPVYEKLEAKLANAMLSIPASKGIEFGKGFESAKMNGSNYNDHFILDKGEVKTKTNNAGGTLGGISTGMPLDLKVAFKPTSSICKQQYSVSIEENRKEVPFAFDSTKRHDPVVAIRAVPVVEAMSALVIADLLLTNKTSKI
ncbi:MAG: chorismate synthase [Rhabdochlamydiaceae bacterium]|nr:chorismate synthase [Candidatus Amphrikana amoebophyrae]